VFFEAPHRLSRTLDDLKASVGPDRRIAILNELTKRFERVFRGTVATAIDRFREVPPRGEFVLVLAAPRSE
jgi:16S rRNA (cytidine1402-2'-O)-methyltransferase